MKNMDEKTFYVENVDENDRTTTKTTENKTKRGRKAVTFWPDEKCYKLIDLVKERPALWDLTCEDYKHRNSRESSWNKIAKSLDLPKVEVTNKWNLLRQQFRNAHNKVQLTKKGRAAAAQKPPNKFYSSLCFMQPIISMDSGSRMSTYRTTKSTTTEKKTKRDRKAELVWSDEQCYKLIDLVKAKPTLWDFTNGNYKNHYKREFFWKEISKSLNLPKTEICNKWNLLRQQFRNAHKKVQSSKSGRAAAARKPPNKFYNALNFMQPILSLDSRSRLSSYTTNEDKIDKDADGYLSELDSSFDENCSKNPIEDENCDFDKRLVSPPASSLASSPASSLASWPPPKRKIPESKLVRTDFVKQACHYLSNTKEDDEFELWGKSVAATLRNYPDASAVRLAKSKMNRVMASLEAGELNSSNFNP